MVVLLVGRLGRGLTGGIDKGTFEGDGNVLGLHRVVGHIAVNTFIANKS